MSPSSSSSSSTPSRPPATAPARPFAPLLVLLPPAERHALRCLARGGGRARPGDARRPPPPPRQPCSALGDPTWHAAHAAGRRTLRLPATWPASTPAVLSPPRPRSAAGWTRRPRSPPWRIPQRRAASPRVVAASGAFDSLEAAAPSLSPSPPPADPRPAAAPAFDGDAVLDAGRRLFDPADGRLAAVAAAAIEPDADADADADNSARMAALRSWAEQLVRAAPLPPAPPPRGLARDVGLGTTPDRGDRVLVLAARLGSAAARLTSPAAKAVLAHHVFAPRCAPVRAPAAAATAAAAPGVWTRREAAALQQWDPHALVDGLLVPALWLWHERAHSGAGAADDGQEAAGASNLVAAVGAVAAASLDAWAALWRALAAPAPDAAHAASGGFRLARGPLLSLVARAWDAGVAAAADAVAAPSAAAEAWALARAHWLRLLVASDAPAGTTTAAAAPPTAAATAAISDDGVWIRCALHAVRGAVAAATDPALPAASAGALALSEARAATWPVLRRLAAQSSQRVMARAVLRGLDR
ncbi:hypothetical protein CXG81DRAFT_27054 [Caulochytrium protostelioides]|uniref:Uncharacterized protein n=1 Tax=Caulochytrium protostelioides TaxID=1555241 RepID=A0A4P9X570_9FUNG|nr:hypothetical protein CXG81DRAFT_27054 [Caulochytrium protostelioides]|eukprot:RKP00235.1 hypothetical protein CXG81DRAFT_27054 [Caulochytrium protostelioides]